MDNEVERVLREFHSDVVFRVNFKNGPLLAVIDVLGQSLSDERMDEIIKAVHERLRGGGDIREEAHIRQVRELHEEHGTLNEVERVLLEIHRDVVFRVNFKNSPLLAAIDVLGQDLSDERLWEIIEAVNERLKRERVHEETHLRQIRELHAEQGFREDKRLNRLPERELDK